MTEPKDWATGVPAVVNSVYRTVSAAGLRRSAGALRVINQPEGFDCPGCAWPEPPPGERHRIEFCESGAKAIAHEATKSRADRAFFAEHSLADLRGRTDQWLTSSGRLTEPMVKQPGALHFEPISWEDALGTVAASLRSSTSPDAAIFYTSGRTSNEAAFVYQLLARCFGTNNLPDCSNLCHEPTSVALEEAIGIGKGSVRLADFVQADLIVIAGQNPGSNHPRMLTTLEAAKAAGARIIAINPLREAGLVRFKNPQTLKGIAGRGTKLADLHLAVRLGGDQALFQLWCKWLLESGDIAAGIDREFLESSTSGLPALAAHLSGVDEGDLLERAGLDRESAQAGLAMVAGARRMIVCWAMGITHHVHAVDTIREIVNLALLGGHIGRAGAGLCPVRGHSNVQGDRTMGVFERPTPALLDAMEREFGLPMPRKDGLDSVAAISAMATGAACVFVGLGGNLARAAPDTALVEAAFSSLAMNVGIATTLNRTHLLSDGLTVLLPTLGRTDVDMGLSGPRTVSVEDSMGMVHGSTGVLRPPSDHVRSEVTILAGLGTRLFNDEHPVAWSRFGVDYDVIRDHISRVVPGFTDFSARLGDHGGFELPHAPRDRREFDTASGRAQFGITHVRSVPTDALLLQTMRSHDQFNTSVYTSNDRYRSISGERDVLFMSATDLRRLGLQNGQRVDVVTDLPGPERRLRNQRLIEFPTPPGSAAAYFPEANVLVPLDHHGTIVSTPGYKSVPVRLEVVHMGALVAADSRSDGLSNA